MSGFILDLVSTAKSGYTHVKDFFGAGSFRLLWSSTDDPDGTKDTGIIHGPKALFIGNSAPAPYASFSDKSVTTPQAWQGSATISLPSHGEDFHQGDIVVITASSHTSNLGVYHVSGYNANSLIISYWLHADTTSVTFDVYNGGMALYKDGRIEAMANILDESDGYDSAYSFNYRVERGDSDGASSNGLLIRPVLRGATTAGMGATHFPLAIYRGLYGETSLFAVNHEGTAWVMNKLAVGKANFEGGTNNVQEPDGIFDCTPVAADIDAGTYSYPFPRVTTAQRNALSGMTDGACVFDITLHKLFVYESDTWTQK